MKKLSYILISLLLVFTLIMPCLAVKSSEDVTEKSNYDILLEKGYPEEVLNGLDENMLSHIVELVGAGEVSFAYEDDYDYTIARTSRDILSDCGYPDDYLEKISDDAVMKLNAFVYHMDIKEVEKEFFYFPEGTTEENAEIRIELYKGKGEDKEGAEMIIVSAYYEWLKKDFIIRKNDELTLNWPLHDYAYISDSFYSEDYTKSNLDNEWTLVKEHKAAAHLAQGELSGKVALGKFGKYTSGHLCFLLGQNVSAEEDKDNTLTVKYEYGNLNDEIYWMKIVVFNIVFIIVAVKLAKALKRHMRRKKKMQK